MSLVLRLPTPPEKYSKSDQDALRRALEDFAAQIPEATASSAATGIDGVLVKAANQTLLGASSFTAISEIGTFAVLANEVWVLQIEIYFTSAAATGMNFRCTVPTGTTGVFNPNGNTSSITTWVTNVNTTITTAGLSAFGAGIMSGRCLVNIIAFVGANAGNIVLEADAITNNMTILAGSWSKAEQAA